jgi:addiction module HigA family antidote
MLPRHRLHTLPGDILQTEFLEPLAISQLDFAKHLGGSWTQPKLNAVIKGKRQVTVDIALDFAEALGTSPQFWMNLQNNYNFALAKKNRRRKIRRIGKRKKRNVSNTIHNK